MTANCGNSAAMFTGKSNCDGTYGQFCRHIIVLFSPNGVPAPFQRRCLARSPVEIVAEYSIQTVIQLSGTKKKPVHRHKNPSGSFPLAWVLVWLSMYRLKSRIQLSFNLTFLG